jgi:hypothetical protein
LAEASCGVEATAVETPKSIESKPYAIALQYAFAFQHFIAATVPQFPGDGAIAGMVVARILRKMS